MNQIERLSWPYKPRLDPRNADFVHPLGDYLHLELGQGIKEGKEHGHGTVGLDDEPPGDFHYNNNK